MEKWTPAEREAWYEERLRSLPPLFLAKAVQVLRDNVPEDVQAKIREAYATDGRHEWIAPYHHGWGTSIRNLFRQNGLTDDALPDAPYPPHLGGGAHKNWDDYYVQVVEAAFVDGATV